MAGSIQQFWQMIVRSGLHDEAACRQFADAFFKAKESGALGSPASLPEWLVTNKALTRYQAKILIAGRPGPFVFGEYVVSDRIDAGRLAGQFRAVHRVTGCPVCLRFLSGPAAADGARLATWRAQARVASAISQKTTRLGHCYALVDAGGYKFFVLESLVGESLVERIARPEPISPTDAVRIVTQTAHGLSRLHAAGNAHGDIGPESIWLDKSAAKLLSFPWSPDAVAPATPVANTGAVAPGTAIGAADYWPPERTPGVAATPSGDIYALGCVLHRLLAGGVPSLSDTGANINPELAALIARMRARKAADRFANAAELLKALAKHDGGVDTAPVNPPALRVALDAAIAQQPQAVTAEAPIARPASVATSAAASDLAAVAGEAVVAPKPAAGVAALTDLDDDAAEPVKATKTRATPLAPAKKKNLPLLIAAASTGIVLAAAALLILTRGFGGNAPTAQLPTQPPVSQPAQNRPDGNPPNQNSDPEPNAPVGESSQPPDGSPTDPTTGDPDGIAAGNAAGGASAGPAEQIIAVNGEMWASPTAGKPLDLAYVPPGAEVIIALRPAALLSLPEGERLLDSRTSGAVGEWIRERLPVLAGAKLENIEQATISLLPGADGPPQLALVAQLKEAPAEADLLKDWGNPAAKEADGKKYFEKDKTGYYVPAAGAGRTIVVAPAALLAEDILPAGADAPALRREMEILHRDSDADRMVTLLAAPSILLTGGDEWLPGSAARARSPLDWFLAGEAEDRQKPTAPAGGAPGKMPRRGPMTDLSSVGLPKAVLASAHLTADDLFVEVRLLADPNQKAAVLAEAYRERVARLPRKASDYLRTLALSDYSRDVLIEFPLMVEQMARFTVAGVQGRQVVLRAYLPSLAAHNLTIAGHLAMLENPRPAGGAPQPTPPGGPGNPPADTAPAETVAQRLDRKISLNFERNTLEPTLKQIGQEIGVDVIIMGADLQNDGITRNKAIDRFEERDLPAREIMLKIMLKANPDGKLVYVIKPAENGAGEALHFTTRAAAAARGDKLPAEFAQ